MMEGSLFALLICHVKISHIMTPLATLLVQLESP